MSARVDDPRAMMARILTIDKPGPGLILLIVIRGGDV